MSHFIFVITLTIESLEHTLSFAEFKILSVLCQFVAAQFVAFNSSRSIRRLSIRRLSIRRLFNSLYSFRRVFLILIACNCVSFYQKNKSIFNKLYIYVLY